LDIAVQIYYRFNRTCVVVSSTSTVEFMGHPVQLVCGVPQGSVLGLILFIMYTVDLIALVERHGLCPHLYADDMQIYGSCPPSAVHDLQQRLSASMHDVHFWMQSNRLQLNTNKTELLWCTTAGRQHQLPRSAFRIGSADIIPTTAVRDLGIYIDADPSMRSHAQQTIRLFCHFVTTAQYCRKEVWRPLQTCEDSRVVGLACVCVVSE